MLSVAANRHIKEAEDQLKRAEEAGYAQIAERLVMQARVHLEIAHAYILNSK